MNEPIPATGYKMHCHDQKQEVSGNEMSSCDGSILSRAYRTAYSTESNSPIQLSEHKPKHDEVMN